MPFFLWASRGGPWGATEATIFLSVAGILGLGVSGYVIWISLQSLKQAARLRNPIQLGFAEAFIGQAVALRGRVNVVRPANAPGFGDCLWYKYEIQERRRSGKNSHWATVDKGESTAEFLVSDGSAEVYVVGPPTEVHGRQSRTDRDRPGFMDQLFSGQRPTRVIHHWLPVPSQVTVLGRLETRGDIPSVVKDKKLGLLFSPEEPGKAAGRESLKGWAGLVGTAFVLVFVAWAAWNML